MISNTEEMMKSLVFFVFSFFLAATALAGEIYGTISEAGKPVSAGVKVEITIAENSYTGETDKFGTYHVFAKEKGKCTLTVYYKGQKPAASIFSYEKATRYDWTVETAEDGKLNLKRN
jgi:hypothetical protein